MSYTYEDNRQIVTERYEEKVDLGGYQGEQNA